MKRFVASLNRSLGAGLGPVLLATLLVAWLLISRLDLLRSHRGRGSTDGVASTKPRLFTGLRDKPSASINLSQLRDIRLDQDDPSLLPIIRSVLVPPSTLPYNLTTKSETSHGQGQLMRKLFKDKRNGFFIECGALNGERGSNTLTLEKELGWRGLLAEGDQKSVPLIKSKHRKAFLLPHCLSLARTTTFVTYRSWFNIGKVVSNDAGLTGDRYIDVLCFPLAAVLRAMNVTKVDYFSLDVEGSELHVLRTIDFDEVDITALSVEYIHMDGGDSRHTLKRFMEARGYSLRATVVDGDWAANDYVFVKRGFNEEVRLPNIRTAKGEIPVL